MSKALVIKGANYNENKVATISFIEPVDPKPCTGITLSQSTLSFTNYTAVTITATLTPSDTSDVLEWASSDTTVATVNNGVITPVGLGTCTITATCGSQSATVSVSVAFSYIAKYKLANISIPNDADFAQIGYNAGRISLLGSGVQAGTYDIEDFDSSGDEPVIKLPANTKSVTLSVTDGSRIWNSTGAVLFWFKDEPCSAQGHPTGAKYLYKEDAYNMKNETSKTFNVYEGADSMAFNVRLSTDASGSETADSIATSMGLSITFNTTEVSAT